MDIFLTDTPMHSFMGGITVHTAPPSPPSQTLVVVPCPLFFFFVFFNSGMTGGNTKLNFMWCPVYFDLISKQP